MGRRRKAVRARHKLGFVQVAMEFIDTYIWSILIISIVAGLLLLFIKAPPAIAPNQCTFSVYVYCQGMVFGSNSAQSSVLLLLTNSRSYPVIAPSIELNASGFGTIQGTCFPDNVLPSGLIICSMNGPSAAIGSFEHGTLTLTSRPCSGTDLVACQGQVTQQYVGEFTSHVVPIQDVAVSISVNALNITQRASGAYDRITATVRLGSSMIYGAGINFTESQTFPTLAPRLALTDANGNAYTYISSTQPGNVVITAAFGNYISSIVVHFVTLASSTTSTSSSTTTITVSRGMQFTRSVSCFDPPPATQFQCVTPNGVYQGDSNYKQDGSQSQPWNTLLANGPPGASVYLSCTDFTASKDYLLSALCYTPLGEYNGIVSGSNAGTWVPLTTSMPSDAASGLSCIGNGNTNFIYCVTPSGEYENNGGTWSPIVPASGGALAGASEVISCFALDPQGIVPTCVTPDGVWTAVGKSWQQEATTGPPQLGQPIGAISCTGVSDLSGGQTAFVCVTTDGAYTLQGGSWQPAFISKPLPDAVNGVGCYDLGTAGSSSVNSVYCVTPLGQWLGSEAGNSWTLQLGNPPSGFSSV